MCCIAPQTSPILSRSNSSAFFIKFHNFSSLISMIFQLSLIPLFVLPTRAHPSLSENFAFSSSPSISTASNNFEEDTFIMSLIKREEFSECSLLILQDRFDSSESVDRMLHSLTVSPPSTPITSPKAAYSIKYAFPESLSSELENIGFGSGSQSSRPRRRQLRLKDLKLKLAREGRGNDSTNLTMSALMSSNTLPVRFPVSVSNYRRMSNPCLTVILMINDIRPLFIRQVYNMLTPVYIPITRKDEDFYIFKTNSLYHEQLLMMRELPSRIKFKIAVGSSISTTSVERKKARAQGSQVRVIVSQVCFFCDPGGNPRLLQLPLTDQNLPRADINYFPDFVWDLNGKLLHVSLPYIRAKIEADPPWEGTFNARRGNWKMLFEKFLTVKFNFTYNMFVSTGLDGNKGGGGTGLLLENGTWLGVTGDLISGRADLGIVIANTPKRIHYIDFTNSFYDIGCLTFVTAQPTRIYSPAALLWPFDLGMWTGIGMSILLSIAFFFASFKIMEIWRFGTGEKWSFGVQIQFLLSTFLEQDSPVLPESQTLRAFVALWFFFTMVLTNVYRSKMVTLLAFPVLGKLPQTFEDLAFSDYQVGFMKHGDSAYNTLAASTDPVYVKLVAEMEIFSGVGLKCLEKVVQEEKYGCIAYDFALLHLRERNLSDSETRKLVFAPARTYNIWLGLGTEGKSIYRLNFSKWLSYTRPFFLADIWDKMDMYYNVRLLKRKWWEETGQMDQTKHLEEDGTQENLNLKHIAGAYYILFTALIISTLVFIHELLVFHKDRLLNGAMRAIHRCCFRSGAGSRVGNTLDIKLVFIK